MKDFKLDIEKSFATWAGFIVTGILFFIVPILAVQEMNRTPTGAGQVMGLTTDNSGRYALLPVINFQFDTWLQDPATISLVLGAVLLLLALVIIFLFMGDFRKKDLRYS